MKEYKEKIETLNEDVSGSEKVKEEGIKLIIQNMYKQNVSLEQISSIVNIPIEKIKEILNIN